MSQVSISDSFGKYLDSAAGSLSVVDAAAGGKLDTLETTLTAIETDATAIEALITTGNADLSTLAGAVTASEMAVTGSVSVPGVSKSVTMSADLGATAVAAAASTTLTEIDVSGTRDVVIMARSPTDTDSVSTINVYTRASTGGTDFPYANAYWGEFYVGGVGSGVGYATLTLNDLACDYIAVSVTNGTASAHDYELHIGQM